jgi:hypothetical protein
MEYSKETIAQYAPLMIGEKEERGAMDWPV